jgi:hypothetical protein
LECYVSWLSENILGQQFHDISWGILRNKKAQSFELGFKAGWFSRY